MNALNTGTILLGAGVAGTAAMGYLGSTVARDADAGTASRITIGLATGGAALLYLRTSGLVDDGVRMLRPTGGKLGTAAIAIGAALGAALLGFGIERGVHAIRTRPDDDGDLIAPGPYDGPLVDPIPDDGTRYV